MGVSLTEYAKGIVGALILTVFSTVTVSESVGVEISAPSPTVYEEVSAAENIDSYIGESISKHDTVSTNEDISALLPDALAINKYDSVGTAEDIDSKTTVKPSAYDSIGAAESVTGTLSDHKISVTDSPAITESVSGALPDLEINSNDTVSVSESATLHIAFGASITDSVSLSESVSHVVSLVSSPHDDVTVSENANAFVRLTSLVMLESVTVEISAVDLSVNVTDDVGTAENIDEYIGFGPDLYDSVSITGSASAAVEAPNTSLFESISVAESTSLETTTTLSVDTYESISLTENYDVNVTSLADYLFWKSKGRIRLLEVTAETSALLIDESETVSAAENISAGVASPNTSVAETISVAESTDLKLSYQISVNDSASIAESSAGQIALVKSTSESITTAESVTGLTGAPVASAYDGVSVAEAITVSTATPVEISTYDSVSIAESVSLAPFLALSVSDTVTTTESITSSVSTSNISVYDALSITDVGELHRPYLEISKYETVTISEVVQKPHVTIAWRWYTEYAGYGILANEQGIYANSQKYDATGAIVMTDEASGSTTFTKEASGTKTWTKERLP